MDLSSFKDIIQSSTELLVLKMVFDNLFIFSSLYVIICYICFKLNCSFGAWLAVKAEQKFYKDLSITEDKTVEQLKDAGIHVFGIYAVFKYICIQYMPLILVILESVILYPIGHYFEQTNIIELISYGVTLITGLIAEIMLFKRNSYGIIGIKLKRNISVNLCYIILFITGLCFQQTKFNLTNNIISSKFNSFVIKMPELLILFDFITILVIVSIMSAIYDVSTHNGISTMYLNNRSKWEKFLKLLKPILIILSFGLIFLYGDMIDVFIRLILISNIRMVTYIIHWVVIVIGTIFSTLSIINFKMYIFENKQIGIKSNKVLQVFSWICFILLSIVLTCEL